MRDICKTTFYVVAFDFQNKYALFAHVQIAVRANHVQNVTFEHSFQINEFVDARDLNMGAWFEAQIVNVTKTEKTSGEDGGADGDEEIIYHVKYEE